MTKKIGLTVRVDKIQKVKTRTKNTDKEVWRLAGKDNDGVGKVRLELPQPFDGFNPDEIIDIVVSTSQKSLKDFKDEAENKKKK